MCRVALCGLLLATAPAAPGVLFYSTGDPGFNTTAPTGPLADSGWQFQGMWGGFLGTPVAGNLFITAKHVGGNAGDSFTFRGTTYTATDFFDDPGSDLRIWRVLGSFPEWAPLYDHADEVGRGAVVFGRGTQRGEEVRVPEGTGELKGWKWGTADGVLRWGENTVGSVLNSGQSTVGTLLRFPFNASGGANEAHLSGGDSSGAVFINDGGTWKLAGINYAVDGPYNTGNSGAGFNAAVFDRGGLYEGGEGNWTPTLNLPTDLPGAFYATRISDHLAWIQSIIATAGGVEAPPSLESAMSVTGPWTGKAVTSTDAANGTLTLPAPAGTEFFRLKHWRGLNITDAVVADGNLVLHYE